MDLYLNNFINVINQKMYNKKINELTTDFKIDNLYESDFYILIDILLKNKQIDVYRNKSCNLIANYNIKDDIIYHFDLHLLKNKNDICVLPMLLSTINARYKHIVTFIINHNKKELVYYDSYGLTNNPLIGLHDIDKFTLKIKQLLISNRMIDKKYKMTMFDFPLQLKISTSNEDWFYTNSCIILLSYFIMLYVIENANKHKIMTILKLIVNSANREMSRQIIKYTYVSIKI